MIVFDFIAGLAERMLVFFDRVRRRSWYRFVSTVVFLLLAAAAVLYAQGKWDFPFITRPVAQSTDSDAVDKPTDSRSPSSADKPKHDLPDDPGDTPDDPDDPGNASARVEIAQMSDLSAEGYYVTTNDYDPAVHRIAVLNVDLGAPEAYTVRERNVYKETVVPNSKFEYGADETVVEFVAEDRPTVEAYAGYIFVDDGDRVAVCDSYGNELFDYDESYYFAYTRDKNGEPLLFRPSTETFYDAAGVNYVRVDSKTYYRLTRTGIKYSDYVDEIYSRGVHADLPPSYGAATEPYPRSVIVHNVTYLDLKYKLTGWVRTLWGFSRGYGDPFTTGWYDPVKLAEDAAKAEEEYQKLVEEAEKKGEKPPKRPKKTALERYEEAQEAAKLWDETPSIAYNYSGSLACVVNEKGQMWFIDHNGRSVIEKKDVKSDDVTNGRPVVDNYLLPLTNGIESLGYYYFEHRLVRVRRLQYDFWQDQRGNEYITADADELIYDDGTKFPLPEGYDVVSYSNGMILLRGIGSDDRCGFMDYTGAWIVPPELDDAKPFVEGLAPAKRDGLWGVVDTAGNTVIPFEYDSIQTTSSGVIVCHYAGGWTVFAKMALA